jgi:hypothetical protein
LKPFDVTFGTGSFSYRLQKLPGFPSTSVLICCINSSSCDEHRPSSRGGRDSYDDRDRGVERGERAERGERGVERGYGRSEY